MATKRDYTIPYEGLKNGTHHFEFEIGQEFIERNKVDDIKSLDIKVDLIVNKKEKIFTIDLSLSGNVFTKCDRCLEKMKLPILFDNRFYVKTGIDKDSHFENDDDILYVFEGENTIDLSHYIYESIVLAIPLKKVHPDDNENRPTCNSEVMRLLYTNNRKNNENKPSDPRWDALRNLDLE